MSNIKHNPIITILSAIFAIMLKSANAAVAFSSESYNSLSVSSNQSENNYQYLLEIDIKGVNTAKVNFEVEHQTLYLLAYRGSVINEVAISGAQLMRLAYDFPTNANLKNYFRVNHTDKIIISIPKT